MENRRLKNLKPMNHHQAIANGRKGGIRSGQVRRYKKDLKQMVLTLLGAQVSIDALLDEEKRKNFVNMTNDEALVYSQIIKAINGDTQAAIFVRDTSGQKPIDRPQIENGRSIEDILREISSDSEY